MLKEFISKFIQTVFRTFMSACHVICCVKTTTFCFFLLFLCRCIYICCKIYIQLTFLFVNFLQSLFNFLVFIKFQVNRKMFVSISYSLVGKIKIIKKKLNKNEDKFEVFGKTFWHLLRETTICFGYSAC